MRLLPFAKRLLERLRADDRPWLVVVSVGGAGVKTLSRRAWFKDGQSAYVRVPDEVVVSRADWGMFIALDVLVVCEDECTTGRLDAVLHELWRARVAALWFLRMDGWVDGKARIVRLMEHYAFFPPGTHRHPRMREFDSCSDGTLPQDFRVQVAFTREHALLMKEPPLYDDAKFDSARAERCAQLGLDPGVFA